MKNDLISFVCFILFFSRFWKLSAKALSLRFAVIQKANEIIIKHELKKERGMNQQEPERDR